MTRKLISAVMRSLAENWSTDNGHYHVAAAGRNHPCLDPECPRRTAAR